MGNTWALMAATAWKGPLIFKRTTSPPKEYQTTELPQKDGESLGPQGGYGLGGGGGLEF